MSCHPRPCTRKLTLDDIADVRAYERERDEFRAAVIEIKRRRRSSFGTIITMMFENRDTMRFQIQEMARVEKLVTDEDIQVELDTYNPMIPEPGQLCATVFLELTSDDQMREWLPKLVGIERSFVIVLAERRPGPLDHRGGPCRPAHPRRGHRRGALHPVRVHARAGRVRSPSARCASRSTHPDYLEAVELVDVDRTPSCSATCGLRPRPTFGRRSEISTGASARGGSRFPGLDGGRYGESTARVGTGIEMVGSGSMPGARRRRIFYPDDDEGAEAAKAVCAGCSVRVACLEHALSVPREGGRVGRSHRA